MNDHMATLGAFAPAPEPPLGNRVSVIVPSKNRRRRLARTLATLRAQTIADIEIIVSDDGSTDGTADAIRELGDSRVRVVRAEESTGVTGARNRGIAVATGDWIAVCDDDDLWPPTKLASQLESMREMGTGWSFVNVALVDDDLTYLGTQTGRSGDLRSVIGYGNVVAGGCSTVLAARSWIDTVGVFDPTFQHFADWDMWTRLSRVGPVAVPTDERSLYVQHGTMMSMDQSGMVAELALFRSKHEDLRTAGTQGLERVDQWIIGRMRAAGKRGAATSHALRFGTPRDLATWRSVAATWLTPAERSGPGGDRSGGIGPEAAAAIAAVRPIIAGHRVDP